MSRSVQTSYGPVPGGARLALVDVQVQRRPVGPADRAWTPRSLPWWLLVWSGARGYEVRRGGLTAARPPRSWTVQVPGVAWDERVPDAEPEREFIWICFTVAGALPPLGGRDVTIVLDPDDRLPPLARSMRAALARSGEGGALAAHGLLLAMLGELVDAARDGAGDEAEPWRLRDGSAERRDGLLGRVDAQVLRALRRPPSRAQLARALGMSESALAHRFRAETGLTLVERIRWLRIREAKARLAEPGATVKSVAAALGFSSAPWFSRVFAEVAGVTAEAFMRHAQPR